MSATYEDNELFEDSFYNWCANHGLDIYVRGSEMTSSKVYSPIHADVDLTKLKTGILELMIFKMSENAYKVQAIKSIAQLTGCSLTDAKNFYDSKHSFSNVESAQ